ncbi:DoxX family protein [Capnocytophaga canimorsus]|uniref:DoxX family protein n=1 Tax=Capnocytophaga canimorsus (strain 5) TaxID=860228 RepID=F9YS55_CAPCC|nr:DoxX family protein [Capnocytophaga canimorsus]AEK22608.1 DoxX family protein [Capnocytophaga canimorsus Cc5]
MSIFQNKDLGLLILRLSVGLLMIPHGIHKLLNSGALGYIQSLLEAKGLPAFISYGVFVGEIIAPLLIVIGFRTRISALILAATGLMILFLGYDNLFSLTQHGGWVAELAGLFLFGALALAFTGGGKYALSTDNQWD